MKLPVILSGPILRRVEPSQIYIWVATSENYSLSAHVFDIQFRHTDKKYHPLSVQTNTKTVRLGKRLFIHLIHIKPHHRAFPVNQLLGYNLFFKNRLKSYDLSSFDLLDSANPDSIVYEGFDYPTFFINTKKETTILYGSCRKPHGKGDDVLAKADNVIKKHTHNLHVRPNSLFMLGDQIYADDIADPIVPYLHSISQLLIGDDENLSLVEPKLAENPYKHRLNKIQGRQLIIEQLCKFTSSNASNHLLTFGEYAAMYLLNWSPALWNALRKTHGFDTFESLYENNLTYFITKASKEEYSQHQERFIEQMEDIHYFQQSVSKVRRVLANVPTYMIFDDHDITDDWNISLQWKEQVHQAPLGRHTVANGLTAYWAFQGWGNNPNQYDDSFIQIIQQYLKRYNIGAPSYHRWMDTLLNFDCWHFFAPTTPMTLCLDTRTLREYDATPKEVKIMSLIKEIVKPPILVGSKGWKLVDKIVQESSWKQGDSLQIASPTPLYGIDVIESFLKNNIYPFQAFGLPVQYKLDFEAWKYNLSGTYFFLEHLMKWRPKECVILSGDVHYASTVKANIEMNEQSLSVYQLTSSPMKNQSFEWLGGSLIKLLVWLNSARRVEPVLKRYFKKNGILKELRETSYDPEALMWKENVSYHSLEGGTIIQTKNNLGLFTRNSENLQSSLLIGTDEDVELENFNL